MLADILLSATILLGGALAYNAVMAVTDLDAKLHLSKQPQPTQTSTPKEDFPDVKVIKVVPIDSVKSISTDSGKAAHFIQQYKVILSNNTFFISNWKHVEGEYLSVK